MSAPIDVGALLNNTLQSLQEKTNGHDDSYRALGMEVQQVRNDISATNREHASIKKANGELAAADADLKTQLQAIQEQLTGFAPIQQSIEDHETQFKELNDGIQSLRSQNVEYRQELMKNEEALASIRQQHDSLKATVVKQAQFIDKMTTFFGAASTLPTNGPNLVITDPDSSSTLREPSPVRAASVELGESDNAPSHRRKRSARLNRNDSSSDERSGSELVSTSLKRRKRSANLANDAANENQIMFDGPPSSDNMVVALSSHVGVSEPSPSTKKIEELLREGELEARGMLGEAPRRSARPHKKKELRSDEEDPRDLKL